MYLLDTNVVSELRRAEPHAAILAWLFSVRDRQLHLSSITIAELQRGAQLVRARHPLFAEELEAWLEEATLGQFSVLPFDTAAARAWGRMGLGDADKNSLDAMIAAIARTRGLTVVTRNVRDFEPFGVPLLNPFEFDG